MHILDGPNELSRDPRWKFDAHPFPWGVQNAFDGRLATLWLCGETLHSGQFVSVEFPGPAMADAVVMETSPDQPSLRLKLEGLESVRTLGGAHG